MKERKIGFLRELSDKIGQEMEITAFESFFMQMDHAGTLCIKGCSAVEICDEKNIVLHCAAKSIDIAGEGLYLKVYSPQETVVDGEIRTIGIL